MAAADLTKTDSTLASRCAAVASIGAAAIHATVTPAHWNDWVPAGVFFAALAVFQLVWAFAVWSRPAPLMLAAGIVTNVAAAALWIAAHTHGAPFGPHAGQPEAVDGAGICVLLLQCYVVMGATFAWARRREARNVPALNRALVLVGANTVMAFAVTAGLVSGLAGHQHHHGGAAEAQGGNHHEPVQTGQPVTDMGLETGHHHE